MTWLTLLAWPAFAAHELTHAAVAYPQASVSVGLRSRRPYAEMDWTAGTPRPWIRLAHLAPTIVGCLVTAIVIATSTPLLLGLLPSNPFLAAAVGLIALNNWMAYCYPGAGDRDPFGAGNLDADHGGEDAWSA